MIFFLYRYGNESLDVIISQWSVQKITQVVEKLSASLFPGANSERPQAEKRDGSRSYKEEISRRSVGRDGGQTEVKSRTYISFRDMFLAAERGENTSIKGA